MFPIQCSTSIIYHLDHKQRAHEKSFEQELQCFQAANTRANNQTIHWIRANSSSKTLFLFTLLWAQSSKGENRKCLYVRSHITPLCKLNVSKITINTLYLKYFYLEVPSYMKQHRINFLFSSIFQLLQSQTTDISKQIFEDQKISFQMSVVWVNFHLDKSRV